MSSTGAAVGAATALRSQYARALDPEAVALTAGQIAVIRDEVRLLAGSPATASGCSPDLLRRTARAWSKAEARRYQYLAGPLVGRDDDGWSALARRALLNCAPLQLVAGAWLQWLSSPANLECVSALAILRLYASDVGIGHPRTSRGNAYLALLSTMRLADNAVPVVGIVREERIMAGSFYLPSVLLTMSRCPHEFSDEILGADLCLRSVGLLPALAFVQDRLPLAADWTAIDLGAVRGGTGRSRDRQCDDAVRAVLSAGGDAARIAAGFRWALAALRRCSQEQFADLRAATDPDVEMAELLRARARQGAVYHHGFQLADRTLAEWLTDAAVDPRPMMGALAASPLVRPGRADLSPLVGSLVSERGAMFRVFTSHELSVLRRWIDALPAGSPSAQVRPHRDAGGALARYPTWPAASTSAEPRRSPADLREAYYWLTTRADWPGLRRWARSYVSHWLAGSRARLGQAAPQLPGRWAHGTLRAWLAAQHEQGNADSAGDQAALPGRDAVIDACVQAAPFKLIDGAWLQGFTDYELASSETGQSLFATYWDELGNGQPELNHPRIYRETLAAMGVTLPPTGSREFAFWPGFLDKAFRIPVYWLTISRFPKSRTPELLGLNLAMELSGVVSGGHRRDRVMLGAYGFSTRWPDIHLTIDNVASGHSAWAVDAVDSYLTAVSAAQGAARLTDAWNRVRVGYQSFHPPPERRDLAAQKR